MPEFKQWKRDVFSVMDYDARLRVERIPDDVVNLREDYLQGKDYYDVALELQHVAADLDDELL